MKKIIERTRAEMNITKRAYFINGYKIKSLREYRCWSQIDLVNLTHISQTTISRIEKERIAKASPTVIIKLADVFDLLPDDLIIQAYE